MGKSDDPCLREKWRTQSLGLAAEFQSHTCHTDAPTKSTIHWVNPSNREKKTLHEIIGGYQSKHGSWPLLAGQCLGIVSLHFEKEKKKKSYRSRYTFLALLTQWQLTDVYVHLSECGMEMNVCARRDPGTQLVGSAGERHRRERRVSSSQIRAKAETDPLSNRGFRLCVSLWLCVCVFSQILTPPHLSSMLSALTPSWTIQLEKRKKKPFWICQGQSSV